MSGSGGGPTLYVSVRDPQFVSTPAVGDGVTDDSAAIQAAATAAADAGGVLYFPPGTYVASGVNNTAAYTEGNGATLKLKTGGVAIFNGGLASGAQIRGLTFDCQSIASSIGIAIGPDGLSDIMIERCVFINAKYGINGSNSGWTFNRVAITNCVFNTGNWGILFNNVNIPGLQVTNSRFLGGATGSGIDLNVPSGSLSGAVISENTVTSYTDTSSFGGFGIDIAGATSTVSAANIVDVSVTGNTVANCNGDGIHIEGAVLNAAVSGNTIANCGGPGVQIVSLTTAPAPTATNISVTGNTVEGCANSRTTVGAGITVSNASSFQGVIVSSNNVRGCGNAGVVGRGINIQATGRALVIGNAVSNSVGSDATTSGIAVLGHATLTPLVVGNRCWDDQGTATQFFGIRTSTAAASIGLNDLTGNGTGRYSWNSGRASGESVLADAGTPAGNIPADIGCIYQQLDGAAGTAIWVKTSGTGTSGWQTVQDTGGTSTSTPGAVATVNIAHGLGATPTRFAAQAANANARGSPAFHLTADGTNVTLNFAANLTAATSYSWVWSAGI